MNHQERLFIAIGGAQRAAEATALARIRSDCRRLFGTGAGCWICPSTEDRTGRAPGAVPCYSFKPTIYRHA